MTYSREWLDIARVVSIFCVIILHVTAYTVMSSNYGGGVWWVANVYDSLMRWSVPVFVMISGALLLDPKKDEDIRFFLKKRASRILIPVIFWSGIYLLWPTFKDFIQTREIHFDSMKALRDLLYGTVYFHLWFLYMIVGLYLFTPIFRAVVRSVPFPILYFFVIAGLLIAAVQTGVNYVAGSVEETFFLAKFVYYTPYFFAGHLIANSKEAASNAVLISIVLISSFFTAYSTYLLTLLNGGDVSSFYFYDYLSVTVIPASFAVMVLFTRLPELVRYKSLVRSLARNVLGIYLVHVLFLEAFDRLFFKLENVSNPYLAAAAVPLLASLIMLCSFLLSSVLSRIKYLRHIV